MRHILSLVAVTVLMNALVLPAAHAAAADQTLAEVRTLRDQGEFKKAAALADKTLADPKAGLSDADKKQLGWERALLDRVRKDFSYTEEELFQDLQKSVRDLTKEEFAGWLKEGRFEGRSIDGKMQYAGTSVSNLYYRDQSLNDRRMDKKDYSRYVKMWENARIVTKMTESSGTPYALPFRHQVQMTVTANANIFPDGENVRAWLPIPRDYPFQDRFTLLSSTPEPKQVAPGTSLIRSMYFEQKAVTNEPTKFEITYEFSTRATKFKVNPADVKPYNPADPNVKNFTGEMPHVVFTPEIKALAAKIVGTETNPLVQARKFYDWIGKEILYSYALEYCTFTNISDYCRGKGYGDCGQQALLFITLCRSQGIPARWQSSWIIYPGHVNMHDWAEIYVQPYGWMPVDVEVGGAILQYATMLTPEQRKEAHDFYFCGLDQYRLIANASHTQELVPPMKHYRADSVDFQRGELESASKSLYYGEFKYSLKVLEQKPEVTP